MQKYGNGRGTQEHDVLKWRELPDMERVFTARCYASA